MSTTLHPLPRLDRPALVMASVGIVAHGGMLLLDLGLVSTAMDAWRPADRDAQVLCAVLFGVVFLHLVVLAWCGRRVVEYAEVINDAHLATFARRNRARAAARRAGSALLATGGLAPVLLLLTALLPHLLP